LGKIQEVGLDWGEVTNERAMAILNRVKALENKGYSFEGADASVHLMILHATKGYCPPFQVLDYSANVNDSNMDSASRVLKWDSKKKELGRQHGSKNDGPTARATVKVRTTNVSSFGVYVDESNTSGHELTDYVSRQYFETKTERP